MNGPTTSAAALSSPRIRRDALQRPIRRRIGGHIPSSIVCNPQNVKESDSCRDSLTCVESRVAADWNHHASDCAHQWTPPGRMKTRWFDSRSARSVELGMVRGLERDRRDVPGPTLTATQDHCTLRKGSSTT